MIINWQHPPLHYLKLLTICSTDIVCRLIQVVIAVDKSKLNE